MKRAAWMVVGLTCVMAAPSIAWAKHKSRTKRRAASKVIVVTTASHASTSTKRSSSSGTSSTSSSTGTMPSYRRQPPKDPFANWDTPVSEDPGLAGPPPRTARF